MDKTVPKGAAILLDFIGDTEAPNGYGTIYANKQGNLRKLLTSMTLGEIIDAQRGWSKAYGSSASGRYQFMRATLQQLSRDLGLRGTQLFDADFQDKLGFHLLKRRGYEEFMTGSMTRTEFGKRLAQEWASLPVLAATKGGSRDVKRGQSYYAGDGLNKSLVTPATVERVLDRVKASKSGGKSDPQNAPIFQPAQHVPATKKEAAKSVATSKRFWTWLMPIVGTPLAAFGALDWRVQLALVVVITGVGIYAVTSMPQVRKLLGLV